MSIAFRIIGICMIAYGLFSKKIGRGIDSDSTAIYTSLLHYWNKRFMHVHYKSRSINETSFGRQHIFDATEEDKVKIVNWYDTLPPVKDASPDTIAYVYKKIKTFIRIKIMRSVYIFNWSCRKLKKLIRAWRIIFILYHAAVSQKCSFILITQHRTVTMSIPPVNKNRRNLITFWS